MNKFRKELLKGVLLLSALGLAQLTWAQQHDHGDHASHVEQTADTATVESGQVFDSSQLARQSENAMQHRQGQGDQGEMMHGNQGSGQGNMMQRRQGQGGQGEMMHGNQGDGQGEMMHGNQGSGQGNMMQRRQGQGGQGEMMHGNQGDGQGEMMHGNQGSGQGNMMQRRQGQGDQGEMTHGNQDGGQGNRMQNQENGDMMQRMQQMRRRMGMGGGQNASAGGQDAFAAIRDVVNQLQANPDTDWSTINIDALRNHLIDMHEVTINAEVDSTEVEDGARYRVTGTGRTLEAIRHMVGMHASQMTEETEWTAVAVEIPNGMEVTVTASADNEVAKIRALGFMGFMVSGEHHEMHHMAIVGADMESMSGSGGGHSH